MAGRLPTTPTPLDRLFQSERGRIDNLTNLKGKIAQIKADAERQAEADARKYAQEMGLRKAGWDREDTLAANAKSEQEVKDARDAFYGFVGLLSPDQQLSALTLVGKDYANWMDKLEQAKEGQKETVKYAQDFSVTPAAPMPFTPQTPGFAPGQAFAVNEQGQLVPLPQSSQAGPMIASAAPMAPSAAPPAQFESDIGQQRTIPGTATQWTDASQARKDQDSKERLLSILASNLKSPEELLAKSQHNLDYYLNNKPALMQLVKGYNSQAARANELAGAEVFQIYDPEQYANDMQSSFGLKYKADLENTQTKTLSIAEKIKQDWERIGIDKNKLSEAIRHNKALEGMDAQMFALAKQKFNTQVDQFNQSLGLRKEQFKHNAAMDKQDLVNARANAVRGLLGQKTYARDKGDFLTPKLVDDYLKEQFGLDPATIDVVAPFFGNPGGQYVTDPWAPNAGVPASPSGGVSGQPQAPASFAQPSSTEAPTAKAAGGGKSQAASEAESFDVIKQALEYSPDLTKDNLATILVRYYRQKGMYYKPEDFTGFLDRSTQVKGR